MDDLPGSGLERTGNESSMAAPWEALAANHHNLLLSCKRFQTKDPLLKQPCLHEGLIAPWPVSAELPPEMDVGDARLLQEGPEILLDEMGEPLARREPPDVHDNFDPEGSQEVEEFLTRAGAGSCGEYKSTESFAFPSQSLSSWAGAFVGMPKAP